MLNPANADIVTAFKQYEPDAAKTLLTVRDFIFETVQEHPVIGQLVETLKWGEPAYLTERPKTGSTLRLGQTRHDKYPALFVNCKTDLIAQFREIYPDSFDYVGVRALVIQADPKALKEELKHCIALAMTYHKRKAGPKRVASNARA